LSEKKKNQEHDLSFSHSIIKELAVSAFWLHQSRRTSEDSRGFVFPVP